MSWKPLFNKPPRSIQISASAFDLATLRSVNHEAQGLLVRRLVASIEASEQLHSRRVPVPTVGEIEVINCHRRWRGAVYEPTTRKARRAPSPSP